MKKIAIFALAAILLLACLVGCGSKAPVFVEPADYATVEARYQAAVRGAIMDGLLTVDENNNFRPQETVSYAEAADRITAIMGGGEGSTSTEPTISGLAYAQLLMEKTGSTGDNFVGELVSYNANLTDAAVTREQAAQLLYNYYTYKKALKAGLQNTQVSLAGGNGVKLLGRAEATDAGVLTNFPGDGIEFVLECAGPMKVYFNREYKSNYCLSVDGVQTEFRAEALAEGTTLAGMIPMGKHTIRIVQDSEINTSGLCNTITGISALCKADTLTPAPKRDLYIEFIGDSLTAGQGTMGGKGTKWNFDAHSGTHTYAYMTAEKLDADYSIVAKGGIGAYMCSSSLWENAPYLAGQMYEAQNVYKDAKTPALTSGADIVIINLGSNDREEDPDTRFETKFKEIVVMARDRNPSAEIVFVYNMFNGRHMEFYKAYAEELGGAEAGYHSVMLERLTNGVATSSTATPHPGVEDNMKNSDNLVAFLKTIPSVQAKRK